MNNLVKLMDKIEFPNLFSGDIEIERVAFNFFGIDIYWYGVIIALGVILAFIYGLKKSKKFGLISDEVFDVVFISIIAGFIGARAYYCIFIDSSINFFDTRHGGLAIYGGIILAVIACIIVCKIKKMKIAPLLDLGGLGLLIGQCIGRWGNFVNQEAFGAPTANNLPWGMTGTEIVSSPQYIKSLAEHGLTEDALVHPCFLYESLWCLIGFLVLHFYAKKLRSFDGEIFLLYAGWYGLGRSWIEGLRTDSLYIGTLRVSQVVALASFILAVGLFIYFKINLKKDKGYVLYKDSDESKEKLEKFEKQIKVSKEMSEAKKAIKASMEPVAPSILGDDTDDITVDNNYIDTIDPDNSDIEVDNNTSDTEADVDSTPDTNDDEN